MTPQLAALKGRLAYRQGFMTLIELAHKLLCTDSKAARAIKEALGEHSRKTVNPKKSDNSSNNQLYSIMWIFLLVLNLLYTFKETMGRC